MDANVLLFQMNAEQPYQRGDVLVFESRRAAPVFPDGTRLAKIAVGVPGDTVEITPDERILVNGRLISTGLPYLNKLSEGEKRKFIGRKVLGKDEFWMMGTTEHSFDSRYWGSINANQVLGKS